MMLLLSCWFGWCSQSYCGGIAANDDAVDDTIYADDAAVAADDAADKATAIAETAVNMVL